MSTQTGAAFPALRSIYDLNSGPDRSLEIQTAGQKAATAVVVGAPGSSGAADDFSDLL
jgi:hypothetical protein